MVEPKEFWLKKADEFKKLKKIDEALECMEKVRTIEKMKNKPDFWYQKGYAYIEIGEYDEALECFEKHLELNKLDFNTMYQKGIAFYFLGKKLEAIECFNKAYELKYAEYLQIKEQNQTLKDHHEYEKALKYETKLDHIFSLPLQFWHYKGLTLTDLGNYKKAMECYDEALSVRQDEPQILFDKARCELLQGNEESCLQLLKKACTKDSNLKNRLQSDDIFSKFKECNQIHQLIDK